MARAIEVAVLACLMVSGCSGKAPPQTERAAAAGGQAETAATDDQARLNAASQALFLTLTKDPAEFSRIDGAVGMSCVQTGRTVQLLIRKELLRTFGLSVVSAEHNNLKIYYPMNDGFVGQKLTIKPANSDEMVVTIEKQKSVDPSGGENDGRTYAIPIWDKPGRHTFIVTGFLWRWYAEGDGDPLPKAQYQVKAYCSLTLS